ncbi:hypothetical protein [Georgenia subflava]|uniref:hypothetical protein n=1 Tax=Georgenia subflava TaxID=1622177 RepID=UPI00186B4109|nr:hypothetical protein [Georgenia subflava]
MDPYIGHPHDIIARVRLEEAAGAAERARLRHEQPDRWVRRPFGGRAGDALRDLIGRPR